MKYIASIIFILLALQSQVSAALGRTIQQTPGGKETAEKVQETSGDGFFSGIGDFFGDFFTNIKPILFWTFIVLTSVFIVYKSTRLAFELYYSKNLRYLQITLPRADSKLDKDRETKKDFKEKIGMMSMFYKAIHKLSEAGLRDTVLNFFFGHSKIALELVYDK